MSLPGKDTEIGGDGMEGDGRQWEEKEASIQVAGLHLKLGHQLILPSLLREIQVNSAHFNEELLNSKTMCCFRWRVEAQGERTPVQDCHDISRNFLFHIQCCPGTVWNFPFNFQDSPGTSRNFLFNTQDCPCIIRNLQDCPWIPRNFLISRTVLAAPGISYLLPGLTCCCRIPAQVASLDKREDL